MPEASFKEDYPIIVGICGMAGSGKTSTAETIVPQIQVVDNESDNALTWDHMTLAAPLYELASIKKGIYGEGSTDRQLYEIHRVLVEILGSGPVAGAPPYDTLIELVRCIQADSLPGDDIKPRKFLQSTGDLCRDHVRDCFPNLCRRKAVSRFNTKETPFYAVIVSDIRFQNEIDVLKKNPNTIIFKLDTDEEIRRARLLERDGDSRALRNLDHESEHLDLNESTIDFVIDNNEIDLKTTALLLRSHAIEYFSLEDYLEEDETLDWITTALAAQLAKDAGLHA